MQIKKTKVSLKKFEIDRIKKNNMAIKNYTAEQIALYIKKAIMEEGGDQNMLYHISEKKLYNRFNDYKEKREKVESLLSEDELKIVKSIRSKDGMYEKLGREKLIDLSDPQNAGYFWQIARMLSHFQESEIDWLSLREYRQFVKIVKSWSDITNIPKQILKSAIALRLDYAETRDLLKVDDRTFVRNLLIKKLKLKYRPYRDAKRGVAEETKGKSDIFVYEIVKQFYKKFFVDCI